MATSITPGARRRVPETPHTAGLLDYEGVAEYLGTTPRHVRRLWAERRLTGIKVGRMVRFAPADLDRYIAAQRVKAVRGGGAR